MALSKAVQFRGIKNAIDAYEAREVPRWGLFCGTQFLDKYEGDDLEAGKERLQAFLNALDKRSADTNTYTLTVYEDTAGKINSSTKYDGSFNFRLVDNIDDYRSDRAVTAYENRIAGLEKKLLEITEPDLEPELTVKDKMFDALGKILEHPNVQMALAQKLSGLIDGVGDTLGSIFRGASQPMQRGAIGAAPNASNQDENQKLQQAINILAEMDPQLGTHLLQLAQAVIGKPEKYHNLISMFKLL